METLPLYGRESELSALDELIDGLGSRGAAIVVRGEAGIGKSSLVDAAVRTADARAMSVLRTTGVLSEANLPFAGLHQLLQPRIAELGTLPSPQRAALEAAFGMTEEAAPDLFLIALATLNLLADVAERAPLLLVVEDAHWLDRSTSQVLAFVARRLSLERILLLLAIRDGTDSVFDTAGLDELRVEPLDDESAAELLDSQAPDLVPSVRERLLRDAAGNPLALIELPDAVETAGRTTLPDHLPLTARLETAFAARLPELPTPARTVLLVAAADGGMSLPDVLDAAAAIEGRPVDADALALARVRSPGAGRGRAPALPAPVRRQRGVPVGEPQGTPGGARHARGDAGGRAHAGGVAPRGGDRRQG